VKELGLRGNKAEQGGNCPAGQKNERVGEFLFIFFPKFPKQIFKLVLNSLLSFESNHSVQKYYAAARMHN
jgi:hypothetical protein